MKFGLDIAPTRFEPERLDVVGSARWAEDVGFDAVSLADHLVPYPPATPVDLPMPDVWVALGAVANATRRVALVPLVCNAALHHPLRLAKLAATLDSLSAGRVTFGIGAGGYRTEEVAMGRRLRWAERLGRLEESITAVRRLWNGQAVDFAGEHFSFTGQVSRPQPTGAMPVLVGGQSAGVMDIAARHADAVNFAFPSQARAATLATALWQRCEALGRDRSTLAVTVFERVFLAAKGASARSLWRRLGAPAVGGHPGIIGSAGEVVEHIERLAGIGVDMLFVSFADSESRMRFAESILPLYAGRETAARPGDA